MVRESVAILIVGVVLMGAFLRSRHYGYMLGALPVCILPVGHLIILGVLKLTGQQFFGIRPQIVTAFADMVAVVLACLFVVIFGLRIPARRIRLLYMVIMLVYVLLLGWCYIFTAIKPLIG